MGSKTTFHLKLIDSNSPIFEGEVYSVTSKNRAGEFDILPLHADFVSNIIEYIIIRSPSKKITRRISSGVLKCISGQVEIFIGMESVSTDI